MSSLSVRGEVLRLCGDKSDTKDVEDLKDLRELMMMEDFADQIHSSPTSVAISPNDHHYRTHRTLIKSHSV